MTPSHTRRVRVHKVDVLRLTARAPFNFRLTTWKPSHFATGLESHSTTITRRSFRLGNSFVAVEMSMATRALVASVYANGQWTDDMRLRLGQRLQRAYGLSEDISEFARLAAKVPATKEAARRLHGMRISCPESVFEISVLSLLLQNTTIGRSTQMMELLLNHYGAIVQAPGWSLRAFFSPDEMLGVSEADLRSICRMGYRAKYLPRFAEFFSANPEEALAEMTPAALRAAVEQIKGVGPYTSNVIASHALRDPDALPVDVWNRRLLARALLGVPDVAASRIQRRLSRLFPGTAGLAALYLIEAEYLSKPLDPLKD